MTVIDARFAGGPIEVATAPLAHSPEMPAVRVDGPGFALVLFPHEARALAAGLLEAAAEAAPVRS